MDSIEQKSLKAGVWYVICNMLTKGIVILSTPIFTRMLTTEDFGIFNNFQSWVTIATVIVTFDLYTSIQRAKFDYENDIDGFISSILVLSSISVIAFYIAYRMFSKQFESILSLDGRLVNILLLYLLVSPAFTFLQNKHRVYMQYKEFTVISFITSFLSVLVSIAFILLTSMDKYLARIIGNLIPLFAVSLFIYIYLLNKGKKFFHLEYWKYALFISVPLIPHHLSMNILSQFDRIMIQKISGSGQTGIYSLAYNYATLLSIVWMSFNGAWSPWFMQKMNDKRYKDIIKASKPYIILFSAITLGLVIIAPEAISIMAPNEYREGLWVIPPILAGLFFQFMYSLYVNIEFYYKKTWIIPIGTAISAILNIVLNILLLPVYGYIAAGYTTLISYILLFILHFFISKKIQDEKVFSNSFIISIIIIVLFLTLLIMLIYKYLIFRYILIVITFVLIVIIRKNIIYYFKMFKGTN